MTLFGPRRVRGTQDIEHKIACELESLGELLKVESSALRLDRFDASERVVYLEVSGDCPDCDVRAETFVEGIEAHLRRRIPGIAAVRTTTRAR